MFHKSRLTYSDDDNVMEPFVDPDTAVACRLCADEHAANAAHAEQQQRWCTVTLERWPVNDWERRVKISKVEMEACLEELHGRDDRLAGCRSGKRLNV